MKDKVFVTLHTPDGERQVGVNPPSPDVLATASPETSVETPDTAHFRRSAYAAMKDLEQQFTDAGIDTEQVWEYLKNQHSVDSRAKFTTMQWVRIATELQAARRDATLFKIFVDGIPDAYFRLHVYASDPNVAIGRPKIRLQHIANEWGDFQQIANENGCELTVTQGKRTVYYEPSPLVSGETTPEPSPQVSIAQESEPIPVQKPDVSLETNAHGEVLNVFGDVVEIHTVMEVIA